MIYQPQLPKDEQLKGELIFASHLKARVECIGAWIWIKFPSKPNEEVRAILKLRGWEWASKRGMWYFAGVPSRGHGRPLDTLRNKYGSFVLNEELNA